MSNSPSQSDAYNEEAYMRSVLSCVNYDVRDAVRKDIETMLAFARSTTPASASSEDEQRRAYAENYSGQVSQARAEGWYRDTVPLSETQRGDTAKVRRWTMWVGSDGLNPRVDPSGAYVLYSDVEAVLRSNGGSSEQNAAGQVGTCPVAGSIPAPAAPSEKEQLHPDTIALRAWQQAFGTTQLSHARARLESAESKAAQSASGNRTYLDFCLRLNAARIGMNNGAICQVLDEIDAHFHNMAGGH